MIEEPNSTLSDPVEVFQRAFWKRPLAGDRILHAERREWSDVHGVQRWQWFIVVEPSSELVSYLRDDNKFNLVSTAAAPRLDDAPSWFSFEPGNVDIVGDPRGNMRLIFSKEGDRLFATDSGGGFRGGAPEVTPPPFQEVADIIAHPVPAPMPPES